ncbi:MAG TPA: hypothetical protein VFI41_04590 [Gemmatimonadales bacterium]|nr:hypothetical protein [Gemmatimonadales bacterium]
MVEHTTGSPFPTSQYLRELIDRLHATEGEISKAISDLGGVVVETSRGLVLLPEDFELQCRALVSSRRCRNYVFDGQLWHYPYAYNIGAGISDSNEDLIFSQLCRVHQDAEPVFPPDWRPL